MVDATRLKLPKRTRPPVHVVLVGLLLVFWNGFGLAGAISAQTGQIPGLDPVSESYFNSQPTWFMLLADLGPLAGLAGAVALLLQHRIAAKLFVAQFLILAFANLYEFAAGTSLIQIADAPVAPTLVAFAMIALQALYAWWLVRRGTLY